MDDKKKGVWEQPWGPPVLLGVIAFAIILAIGFAVTRIFPQWFTPSRNDTFQGISTGVGAVITAVLVGVTIVYVRSTKEIADATKQQADASMEMTEEMKEQRYNALRPTILPECTPPEFAPLECVMKAVLHNLGPGPALDVATTLFTTPLDDLRNEWRAGRFPGGSLKQGQNLPVLGTNQKQTLKGIDCRTETSSTDKMTFSIVVECEDAYDRVFRSGREFLVEKDNRGNWKVTPLAALSPHIVANRLRSYP